MAPQPPPNSSSDSETNSDASQTSGESDHFDDNPPKTVRKATPPKTPQDRPADVHTDSDSDQPKPIIQQAPPAQQNRNYNNQQQSSQYEQNGQNEQSGHDTEESTDHDSWNEKDSYKRQDPRDANRANNANPQFDTHTDSESDDSSKQPSRPPSQSQYRPQDPQYQQRPQTPQTPPYQQRSLTPQSQTQFSRSSQPQPQPQQVPRPNQFQNNFPSQFGQQNSQSGQQQLQQPFNQQNQQNQQPNRFQQGRPVPFQQPQQSRQFPQQNLGQLTQQQNSGQFPQQQPGFQQRLPQQQTPFPQQNGQPGQFYRGLQQNQPQPATPQVFNQNFNRTPVQQQMQGQPQFPPPPQGLQQQRSGQFPGQTMAPGGQPAQPTPNGLPVATPNVGGQAITGRRANGGELQAMPNVGVNSDSDSRSTPQGVKQAAPGGPVKILNFSDPYEAHRYRKGLAKACINAFGSSCKWGHGATHIHVSKPNDDGSQKWAITLWSRNDADVLAGAVPGRLIRVPISYQNMSFEFGQVIKSQTAGYNITLPANAPPETVSNMKGLLDKCQDPTNVTIQIKIITSEDLVAEFAKSILKFPDSQDNQQDDDSDDSDAPPPAEHLVNFGDDHQTWSVLGEYWVVKKKYSHSHHFVFDNFHYSLRELDENLSSFTVRPQTGEEFRKDWKAAWILLYKMFGYKPSHKMRISILPIHNDDQQGQGQGQQNGQRDGYDDQYNGSDGDSYSDDSGDDSGDSGDTGDDSDDQQQQQPRQKRPTKKTPQGPHQHKKLVHHGKPQRGNSKK